MGSAARRVGRMLPGFGIAALCWAAAVQPAAAQFDWLGQGQISSNDVYDTISSHGFRLAGPLMQNRNVYIADVFDRRQRRQRLIISRENGRILQRFLVDVGSSGPYAAAPGAGSQRARSEPDFFSRLARGFGDDGPPPRPPADIDNAGRPEAVEPRLPRPDRVVRPRPADIEPRVATRRDDAPVTSRPLTPEPQPVQPAPVQPTPIQPVPVRPAAVPAAPAPVASTDKTAPVQQIAPTVAPVPAPAPVPAASPPPARATVVTTDPLRIPGVKEAEKPKPATATARATEPVKPATPKAADVPVAPLD